MKHHRAKFHGSNVRLSCWRSSAFLTSNFKGWGTFSGRFSGLHGPNFTELGGDIGHHYCSSYLFQSSDISRVVSKNVKFRTFYPPPYKIREGVGNMYGWKIQRCWEPCHAKKWSSAASIQGLQTYTYSWLKRHRKICRWLTEYQKVENGLVISRKLTNIHDRKICLSATDIICRNNDCGANYYKSFWCRDRSWSNDNNYNERTNNSSSGGNNNYIFNENNGGANNDSSPADYDYSGSCDNYRSNWYVLHRTQRQLDNTGFACSAPHMP